MRQVLPLVFLAAAGAVRAGALFDEEPVLDVRLAGPLHAVLESGAERMEFPFIVSVDGVDIPVEVRIRGNSRLRVCSFPPLRLDFPGKGTAGSVFDGQDKLKLVTHCNDRKRDAGNLLDEYLAYRLFNLVSDDGYRVRLLRMAYVDTDSTGLAALVRDAFLIESDEALAARRGAAVLDTPGVALSRLDGRQAALVYVFQYLIGNTDWSLVTAETADACCHNVDLYERDGRTLPVPYDFDLAGLVHASYARPDASLKIASVRTRRYRGYCISSDDLAAAIDAVTLREADILALAAELPAASEEARRKRREYLGEFFADAADREELLEQFEKRCL
ncbi:MAG TPA: hypothetical protein VFY27_02515 [Woeseiaceae bacterium]|nr:hypothetical protein [Woeseiaceae bacterium]